MIDDVFAFLFGAAAEVGSAVMEALGGAADMAASLGEAASGLEGSEMGWMPQPGWSFQPPGRDRMGLAGATVEAEAPPPLPPTDARRPIMADLHGMVMQRLQKPAHGPAAEGTHAHDRLLLQAIQADAEAAWAEAWDDEDSEALLNRLDLPYERDSDDGRQWLIGFLWANRDAAAWLRGRAAS